AIRTSAPSLAKASAIARPMPLSPPVISATLPSSLPLPRLSCLLSGCGSILYSRPGLRFCCCGGCPPLRDLVRLSGEPVLRRSSALPLRALLLRGWPRSDLVFLSRAAAPERREEDCEEAERRTTMGRVSNVAGRCCNGRTKDPSGRCRAGGRRSRSGRVDSAERKPHNSLA